MHRAIQSCPNSRDRALHHGHRFAHRTQPILCILAVVLPLDLISYGEFNADVNDLGGRAETATRTIGLDVTCSQTA